MPELIDYDASSLGGISEKTLRQIIGIGATITGACAAASEILQCAMSLHLVSVPSGLSAGYIDVIYAMRSGLLCVGGVVLMIGGILILTRPTRAAYWAMRIGAFAIASASIGITIWYLFKNGVGPYAVLRLDFSPGKIAWQARYVLGTVWSSTPVLTLGWLTFPMARRLPR